MSRWLDNIDKAELANLLGELMSAISEDCWHAGWLDGTEYCVPALARRATRLHAAQPWGHGELGHGMAAILMTLSEKLGHWVRLDDSGIGYSSFDPFPTPQKYEDALKAERRIAKEKRKK